MTKVRDIKKLREELRKFSEPAIDGRINQCYGDVYYAQSLRDKYGMSLVDLERIVRNNGKQ